MEGAGAGRSARESIIVKQVLGNLRRVRNMCTRNKRLDVAHGWTWAGAGGGLALAPY